MKLRNLILIAMLLLVTAPAALSNFKKEGSPGQAMTSAAAKFLGSLDEKQRATALLEFGSEKRLDWHFIPKDFRKGLQLRDMNKQQQQLAHALLKSSLSEMGYGKATKIMELESLLNHLEKGKGRFARDPLRYYFTMFGEPKSDAKWGLSIEGHHLSFNFVVESGRITSSTPQFLAANPAEIKDSYTPEFKKGTRVLAKEETLAFDLVNSLNREQAKTAIIEAKAPREIRNAGSPQPPATAPAGIPADKLNESQRKTLMALVDEYVRAMPYEVAAARMGALDKAGWQKIHFAWAGPTKPGIGHYYRVQGPTFLIEFVNTQPDAAGNPANHIHCVWRDMAGDFGLPIEKE